MILSDRGNHPRVAHHPDGFRNRLQTARRRLLGWVLFALLGGLLQASALTPQQVLVLYNSKNPDSLAVWTHYAAARPGVRGFDLNDATLLPGTISYPAFISKIRQPLRTHLTGSSLQQQVVVFVLTKGLPHRIQDLGAGDIGDDPNAAYARMQAGNASFASVDSELTLLWQNLEKNEANGNMDSGADNYVNNPFYGQTAEITSYDRSKITAERTFSKQASGPRWKMVEKAGGLDTSAGNIYLTSRLDGNSVAAVTGMIDRGLHPIYDKTVDTLIEDKSAGGTYDSSDYSSTQSLMAASWPAFVFEQTDTFLIGMNGDLPAGNAGTQRFTGRVAALTGYGGNHSGGSKEGYIATYRGQLTPGAIYNTFESYNARKFGGVGGFDDHGQLSDWVDAGGTFGTGHVWEPLTGAVARNYLMLVRYFTDGHSWVESAWAGTRYLSWQNVVLGDPLSTASFGIAPVANPVATVSASGTLSETSAGAIATATVTLSSAVPQDTIVHVAFEGDADPSSDFTLVSPAGADVLVPAYQTTASFQMVAVKDDLPEGTEKVRLKINSGAGYTATPAEADVDIEDSPFGSWQNKSFKTEAMAPKAAPLADPDGDGLCNLAEYYLALDPLHAADPGAPQLVMEPPASSASYRFTRDLSATDVSGEVECSHDLQHWQVVPSTVISTTPETETIEARAPIDDSQPCFFRLVIRETPGS